MRMEIRIVLLLIACIVYVVIATVSDALVSKIDFKTDIQYKHAMAGILVIDALMVIIVAVLIFGVGEYVLVVIGVGALAAICSLIWFAIVAG